MQKKIFKKIFLSFVFLLLLNVTNVKQVVAGQLHVVDTNGLIVALNKLEDDNKILFFFTSWCPYCKQAMEEIISTGKTEAVVFISLDKDYQKISTMASKIPENIDIYYMSSSQETLNVFKKFDIKYRDTIPHIAVLDEDNQLIKDNINLRQLHKYIR